MSETQTHLSDYFMPSLGADMDEGSVIEWLVGVGDRVERGQVIARVETEKSDIDIEIWQPGTIAEIIVEPGRIVPVGATLLRIDTGETMEMPAPVLPTPKEMERPGIDARHHVESEPDRDVKRPGASGVVWATPLARHLAGEQGIELSNVAGTGPDGAVRATDLDHEVGDVPLTADQPDDMARPSRTDRIRSVIAVRMTRSNDEIPHYRLQRDVDLTGLLAHLSSINEPRPVADRVLPAAAFVRSVAIAAAKHPELNGTWLDHRFHPGVGINVSVAISLRGGGLVTPTIRHADMRTLDEVMSMIKEFAMAARTGSMRSEWTASDSSITVTNLGERGADLVHGLISPPEVALVGFGRVLERPWVVDGVVTPRSMVTVTLGADHRATDGAAGSRFLNTLANALEEPEQL